MPSDPPARVEPSLPGNTPPARAGTTYLNDEAFYLNPTRAGSRERDYGVHWRNAEGWLTYRVTYLYATGELVAVCLPKGTIEVLAVFKPNEPDTVDAVLKGWADHAEGYGSLAWLRSRL